MQLESLAGNFFVTFLAFCINPKLHTVVVQSDRCSHGVTSNEAVYHIWHNQSSVSAFECSNLISTILVLVLHVYSNKYIIVAS